VTARMFRIVRNGCWVPDRRGLVAGGLCLVVLLLATGCGGGYNWRTDFNRAEQDAREQGKTLFILYKWFMDPASNRMLSNEVLSDREVAAVFQDTINVLVDRDYGPTFVSYVHKYKVTTFPACILVSPDGTRYRQMTGFVPREQLIEWVKGFKSRTSQPAKAATKSADK
jgi:hypothetical protein